MKLRQLIQLPLTVFLFSICSALPVSSLVLTPDIFKSSIATGVWFIEHFSPYCGHCRAFAPLWEELVVSGEKGEFPGIKFAQIDCSVNGDLCSENGVHGYPQMNLYRDGEFVKSFNGRRERERLDAFLKPFQEEPIVEPSTPIIEPSVPTVITNPNGEVVVLDEKNFGDFTPKFVKFYAPWCGHCKKLAPTWKKLAKQMQGKLAIAEVNCDEHKSLCSDNGVEGYPALMYFTESGTRTEYTSGRRLEQLSAFAEKASASAAQAISTDELDKYVAENDVVYVILHSDAQLVENLKPFFTPLLGNPQIVTIVNPPESVYTRWHIPSTSWSIIAIKDHDSDRPVSIYTASGKPVPKDPKLQSWLFAHRLPTSIELSQDTFQSIMNAPHRPLVVLAAVTSKTKDMVATRMGELSKKWRERTNGSGLVNNERDVIFTWMDVERWQDWMKSMYGIHGKGLDLKDVEVVIADHHDLIYYASDVEGNLIRLDSSPTLFGAIEGAAHGELKPLNSENIAERIARYLNGKLTWLERYVVAHPMHTVFFIFAAVVLGILAIRKFVSDDVDSFEREYKGKAGRLD